MKYVTLGPGQGIDFRKIAKLMTEAGYRMNHATARNALMVALQSLIEKTTERLGIEITEDKIEDLLKNQMLHDALSEVLVEMYKKIKS